MGISKFNIINNGRNLIKEYYYGLWDSVKTGFQWATNPTGMAMDYAGDKIAGGISSAYNAMKPQDIAAPQFAPYQAYQADPNLLASIDKCKIKLLDLWINQSNF